MRRCFVPSKSVSFRCGDTAWTSVRAVTVFRRLPSVQSGRYLQSLLSPLTFRQLAHWLLAPSIVVSHKQESVDEPTYREGGAVRRTNTAEVTARHSAGPPFRGSWGQG